MVKLIRNSKERKINHGEGMGNEKKTSSQGKKE
jgi:hypothetical protein